MNNLPMQFAPEEPRKPKTDMSNKALRALQLMIPLALVGGAGYLAAKKLPKALESFMAVDDIFAKKHMDTLLKAGKKDVSYWLGNYGKEAPKGLTEFLDKVKGGLA